MTGVLASTTLDDLFWAGQLIHAMWGTPILVETLLARGSDGDIADAQGAIDRLENLPDDDGSVVCISGCCG